MKTIKHIIIILALFQSSLAASQTVKNYDPQTNTYYQGCGSAKINSYENTNMAPALFNWQMVQIPPPFNYFIADIFFVDSLYGWSTHGNGGILKTTNSGFNWTYTEIIPGGGGVFAGLVHLFEKQQMGEGTGNSFPIQITSRG